MRIDPFTRLEKVNGVSTTSSRKGIRQDEYLRRIEEDFTTLTATKVASGATACKGGNLVVLLCALPNLRRGHAT